MLVTGFPLDKGRGVAEQKRLRVIWKLGLGAKAGHTVQSDLSHHPAGIQ